MKFKNYEEKQAAVKLACEQYGEAVANTKYREWQLIDIQHGFVPGDVIASVALDTMVAKAQEEVKQEVAKAAVEAPVKKASTKKVAAAPVKKVEPVVVVEEPEVIEAEIIEDEPVVVVEEIYIPDAQAIAEDVECPITNVEELRQYMTKRYADLGGTPDARNKIRTTLTQATGKAQAADVEASMLPAAYAALELL